MKQLFSEWFGFIYDRLFNIYNPDFHSPVFQYFYDSGFYIRLGALFILIPLVLMAVFYFLWKYPYGKWWHWLIWFILSILVVLGLTFGYANQFINDSNATEMLMCYDVQECASYINALPMEYAVANIFLGVLVGLIVSILFKQWSKVQAHLPF